MSEVPDGRPDRADVPNVCRGPLADLGKLVTFQVKVQTRHTFHRYF